MTTLEIVLGVIATVLTLLGLVGWFSEWHENRKLSKRVKPRTNIQIASGRQFPNGEMRPGRMPGWLTDSDKPLGGK